MQRLIRRLSIGFVVAACLSEAMFAQKTITWQQARAAQGRPKRAAGGAVQIEELRLGRLRGRSQNHARRVQ